MKTQPAATPSAARSPAGFNGKLTCAIQVADIDQSLKFYRDILGFTLLYHIKEIGWCELACEVANVSVGLSQVEKPARLSGTKLTFGVKDIDVARRHLESRGVRFDGPTIEIPGLVRLATFFDPTGNAMMFSQSLAKED